MTNNIAAIMDNSQSVLLNLQAPSFKKCIGKGKDHKPYEYGNKVSVAATAKTNIIVGVVSHDHNCHDNHTLPEALAHIEASRGEIVKYGVCDRAIEAENNLEKHVLFSLHPP